MAISPFLTWKSIFGVSQTAFFSVSHMTTLLLTRYLYMVILTPYASLYIWQFYFFSIGNFSSCQMEILVHVTWKILLRHGNFSNCAMTISVHVTWQCFLQATPF